MTQKALMILVVTPLFAGLTACKPKEDNTASLLENLTFHASFDNGADAEFAKGDAKMYTAITVRPELKIREGLPEEVTSVAGGRFGTALAFNSPDEIKGTRAFFRLPGNFPYENSDWKGTVSFWMKLTPDEDLRPGFTDPIQLTSKSALDAGIWVDFTDKNPRHFRMGVYPDKAVWNPEDKKMPDIPEEQKPWITYEYPPFSRDQWTHICMTIEGFNNSDKNAVAKLYVDGKLHGELTGFQQTYTWDLEKAQIRLGVNFVGAMDELSCFDRALSSEEVSALFELESGVSGLLRK